MRKTVTLPTESRVVEEELHLTLVELCRASGASEQQLFALIDEGALEPLGGRRDEWRQWRFTGTALRRARTAAHLARDLEINPSGIALALDLLERLDRLQAHVHNPHDLHDWPVR